MALGGGGGGSLLQTAAIKVCNYCLYRGQMGILENRTETTILGFRIFTVGSEGDMLKW